MGKNDVSFMINEIKFNYRVAAIFEYKDKLLIQKSEKDSFFSLIGGKVEIGESTIDALKREIKEELNYEIKEKKSSLIRVYENFFKYNNNKYHELLYIYIIKLDSDDILVNKEEISCIDKDYVKFIWIDKKEFLKLEIRPNETKDITENEKFKTEIIKEY